VVDALLTGKKGAIIPYRESMLTSLLADSLGGNCKTTLLAMVSPSQEFCKESNNTLSFAMSCKSI
jgi:kinesin family protein 3/17